MAESVGAIMVDGYEGYEKACQQNHITRIGCWAHTRRKPMDAKAVQKKGQTGNRQTQSLA